MDCETETFCNSTSKNHLQLQLDQPSKCPEDIKNLRDDSDSIDSDGDDDDQKDLGDEGESKTLTSNKIPHIYQLVEPGCTPLSCYSAIVTFIIMTMGIFWLLLISPPKNSLPVTIRPGGREAFLYDYEENYDSNYASSAPGVVAEASTDEPNLYTTPIQMVLSSAENILKDETGT